MNSEVLYDLSDNVATITLNRPEVMNAFGDNTRPLLLEKLIEAENDNDVRCVVITGAGKAFAAGGDIKSMCEQQANNDTETITSRMEIASQIVTLMRRMNKPIIAAINGAAAGAGVNLALACDLRYASEKAILVQSFVKIGLMPDWGGHYLLPQLIGSAKALELCMLGERVSAQKAYEIGLLNDVFPADEFQHNVRNIAIALAKAPSNTLASIKHCTYFSLTHSLEDTLRKEQALQAKLFLSDNAREGMQAFVEKREPGFNK